MPTRLLQIIFVAIPFVIFGWLVLLDIVPSGEMVIEYRPGDVSPFVNSLLPSDRVQNLEDENGKTFARIINEPVYFSVDLPNTKFETVEVEVEFENEDQPIFEVGALLDIFSSSYDLRPFHNLIIEESDWDFLKDGETVLLDRTGEISSIKKFLEDLPPRGKLATYHFDLEEPYRITDYQSLSEPQTIGVSLRGYHQFLTYIKDETFSMNVSFSDMNRTYGEDDVVLRVRNELGDIVLERSLEDDNNLSEDQEPSNREISVDVRGLPEGVYKVELSGTSDIFWRKIVTSQRYVTFTSKIYTADQVGYLDAPMPVEFFTNAKNLVLETTHSESTQTVEFGSDSVHIEKTHEKVPFEILQRGIVRGFIPFGDMKITGDGKFAFSERSFFNPDPVKLTAFSDLDALGVDYILTSYIAPDDSAGVLTNQTTFNLSEISNDSTAKFIVSVPRINEINSTVDIHKITLKFKKKPLSRSGFLKEVISLLPFGL